MRNGIIGEIRALRKGKPIQVDYRNRNRYRVVLQEENGTRTAYYFSTPIYHIRSGKLLDFTFHREGDVCYAVGSNSRITVQEDVLMENEEGYCRTSLYGAMGSGREVLYPTANGVAYKVKCSWTNPYPLRISVGLPFLQIRENGKYFALMREEFRPFVSVSCIGTVCESGQVVAPAEIRYERIDDRQYLLHITPCNAAADYVLFEVNLYEAKLFQDTTVESENPGMNNAFGGTAFIGNTKKYGEQRLYSRVDCSKLPELTDRRIIKGILHLPRLGGANIPLLAKEVSARFCSFGSNWDNKIAPVALETDAQDKNGYVDLDITHWMTEPVTGFLKHTEGLVLRAKRKEAGFTVLATGDSYYAPQILEISFR